MPDVAKYISDPIDMLKGMISIPSVSRDEQAVADYFCHQLEGMGIGYRRHGNNIWCVSEHFDIQKPTILLNAHLDTVKPVPAWTKRVREAASEAPSTRVRVPADAWCCHRVPRKTG